ncbi:MAG: glycosyltransferase family 39 protein [Polyangiaceae bacterium]
MSAPEKQDDAVTTKAPVEHVVKSPVKKDAEVNWRALLTLPANIGWRDHVIGFVIAAIYVGILIVSARTLGFARDEGFYFSAGSSYAHWLELLVHDSSRALDKGTIDGVWSQNHEHPSLMKILFGLSHLFFHEKWELFKDASTSFRFPGMAMSGMALWVTYLFGARVFTRRAGVIAAVLLATMPQLFYNAHLACFDAPIMAMWLLAVYIYYRSVKEGGLGWAVACGIVYGLTLDTKHNAWILPAVFVPHAFFVMRKSITKNLALGRVIVPTNLVTMAILGPLTLVALWPWLWSDTAARVQEWFNFHLHHTYYNMEFLGKNYYDAPSPRGYMPLLILATVPGITLVLFFIGAFDRARVLVLRFLSTFKKDDTATTRRSSGSDRKEDRLAGEKSEVDVLLFLAFAAPLAVFLLPTTPIFGGTKHWLPAYPFLAMFAGHGFDLIADNAEAAVAGWDAMRREVVQGALIACVLIAPIAETAHSHPFGLSAYVPTVGGTAGAADLGLNRQFWGFTTQSTNAWFQKNGRPGARVFILDTTGEAWSRMQEEGRMRKDLRAVGSPSEADYSLVQHELHMNEVDYQIWVAYGSTAPAWVLTHDGVPIISLYKRR